MRRRLWGVLLALSGIGLPVRALAAEPATYIAVIKPGAASTAATELVAQVGAELKFTYGSALKGFSFEGGRIAAGLLARNPLIAFVERDQSFRVEMHDHDPPSWGLDRLDQRGLPLRAGYTFASRAEGVHAYVVDSGIRRGHKQFQGRAVDGYDFVDGDATAQDCHGHGTHVAGTLGGRDVGVAKGVTLVAVRVLDCAGGGTLATILAGVDWVVANAVKPAVVNISIGGPPSEALNLAVNGAIDAGLTVVTAAGNAAKDACDTSPASVPRAITVGATTPDDKVADFSNHGRCLDLFAPGVDIVSAGFENDTGLRLDQGTSMATPHVAGAAAILLARHPSFTPQEIRDELVATATPNLIGGDMRNEAPDLLLFTGACAATNVDDVAIPDQHILASTPAVSVVSTDECIGPASHEATVEVHIRHPYRGQLRIELEAPDGRRYLLREEDVSDDGHDIDELYTLDLSASPALGTWRLHVTDRAPFLYSGYLDHWTFIS